LTLQQFLFRPLSFVEQKAIGQKDVRQKNNTNTIRTPKISVVVFQGFAV
jgi:hypothetical protein